MRNVLFYCTYGAIKIKYGYTETKILTKLPENIVPVYFYYETNEEALYLLGTDMRKDVTGIKLQIQPAQRHKKCKVLFDKCQTISLPSLVQQQKISDYKILPSPNIIQSDDKRISIYEETRYIQTRNIKLQKKHLEILDNLIRGRYYWSRFYNTDKEKKPGRIIELG